MTGAGFTADAGEPFEGVLGLGGGVAVVDNVGFNIGVGEVVTAAGGLNNVFAGVAGERPEGGIVKGVAVGIGEKIVVAVT